MGILWHDLRYGIRILLDKPGFTSVALVALALGIGGNTAIFSIVNAVLLRPLPYRNAERLVAVYNAVPQTQDTRASLSYPDFLDYQTQSTTLEHFTAFQEVGTTITIDAEPERVEGAEVTSELLPLLGVAPEIGRGFTAEEDRPGAGAVIIISHHLWQESFNSDPNIVGREVRRGNRTARVVGVMPPGFKFPAQADKTDILLPLIPEESRTNQGLLAARDERFLRVVAGLRPGATLGAARTEMEGLAGRIAQQYPAMNTGIEVRLVPLHEDIVGNIRPALLVLLAAVGFVLLIACANVANLLLARAAARRKEIAVRAALGASSWRIVRQLLTESLLLALGSGALGLLLAWWGIELLAASIPTTVPRAGEIGLDGRVLAFTLAISALTGVVFGLAPALASSKVDLNEALKDAGRGSTEGPRRNRVRSLLVVSEIALSLMLLSSAGLLIRSFFQLLRTDPGYDARQVLSVTLPISRSKYPEPARQAAFLQEAVERVRTLPGVEAAGATNQLPLGNRELRNTFRIEGRAPAAPGQRYTARSAVVTSDYFRVMSIAVRRGRAFADTDAPDAPPVIVINDALAHKYFPNEEALGQRIEIEDENDNPLPAREIVGIVRSVRLNGLDEDEYPEYYVPFRQTPDTQVFLVARARGGIDPASLAPAIRNTIREADKDQVIWEIRTMGERVTQSVASRRFTALLLGGFAMVALALAGIGIYGVLAYSVMRRRHELGIRMALGAQSRDVLRLVIGEGMLLALAGIGVGLAGALAAARVMSSLLYGVSAHDPLTFAGVALLLGGVALLACYLPARRATKVDPMVALRAE